MMSRPARRARIVASMQAFPKAEVDKRHSRATRWAADALAGGDVAVFPGGRVGDPGGVGKRLSWRAIRCNGRRRRNLSCTAACKSRGTRPVGPRSKRSRRHSACGPAGTIAIFRSDHETNIVQAHNESSASYFFTSDEADRLAARATLGDAKRDRDGSKGRRFGRSHYDDYMPVHQIRTGYPGLQAHGHHESRRAHNYRAMHEVGGLSDLQANHHHYVGSLHRLRRLRSTYRARPA